MTDQPQEPNDKPTEPIQPGRAAALTDVKSDKQNKLAKLKALSSMKRKPRDQKEPDTRSTDRAEGNKSSNEPESMQTAQLHLDLNRLTTLEGDESEIRAEFRKVIQQYTGAVGVGHVIRDQDGSWDLKQHHSTGRVPRRQDFVDRFAKCCNITVERNAIQIESFLGLESFYTPIQVFGLADEVLLVLSAEKNSSKVLFALEVIAAYFGLWLKGKRSKRTDWKLSSLAALIELVSEVEKQSTLRAGCQVIASEMARHLNCQQVAIATNLRSKIQVQALSGASSLETSSTLARDLQTALSETLLRDEMSQWPNEKVEDQQLLLAHKQLANHLGLEAVSSIPLTTPDGNQVGAVILAGSLDLLQGDRLPNFLRASAPRLASALEVVDRAQVSRLRLALRTFKAKMATARGRVLAFSALAVFALLMIPIPYRIRSSCKVDSTVKRFVVAPFNGTIERGYFEPGDKVKSGDLLAEMDDQEIRYELAGIRAEKRQAMKQREIQLAERNVGSSLLSDLESKRLAARQSLLEHQKQQVEMRSPIDGIILSGSLERSQGVSVELGKVLYEVGPLDQLKIQISIPAEEISHVEVGQNARVWIKGLENQSFIGEIGRIQPRSELRDSRNVFVADIRVENSEGLLRPGMEGSVRIDCDSKPLIWNLFHKPWEYIVSRITWW